MPAKTNHRNEYQCTIEVNQNGKYCVRVRAMFARKGWILPVYFLASTFDRAMRKLEAELCNFCSKQEERLWFWGVEHSDDPNFSGELVQEAGLRLDRRAEFPRPVGKRGAIAGKARSGRVAGASPARTGRFDRCRERQLSS